MYLAEELFSSHLGASSFPQEVWSGYGHTHTLVQGVSWSFFPGSKAAGA
jgi:hypothetical protein